MKVVGLTGGIGSGKSTVSAMLEKMGGRIIDADKLAREVVEPGNPAWKDIMREFGEGVLNHDSTINREALAELVFRDEKKRRRLNQITHPRIGERMIELIDRFREQGAPVAIIDAALLIESPATRWIKPVIVVAAGDELKIERIMKRDGAAREEVEKRIRSQMPDREKRKHADYVIENSGDLAGLEEQVRKVWEQVTGRAGSGQGA